MKNEWIKNWIKCIADINNDKYVLFGIFVNMNGFIIKNVLGYLGYV